MNDTITSIRITDLHESPFNPRKTFDDAALQELATDIRAQGRVLQPLLVRPRIPPLFGNNPEAVTGHEIVFGHRRFRAAEIAGLAEVPCMVRAMTDDEARAAQISENLSRQDVHPIEEAEGFQALLDSGSHTADEIAAQFGKSRSYVYGRLKLLEACPEIRKACLAGDIGSEVALLVARLRTPKLQEKALGYIRAAYRAKLDDGGKASYRSVRDLLNEKFMLYLDRAIFDPEEEMLVPTAGNCITCPKRSENAPEFADVVQAVDTHKLSYSRHHGGANVCTDPDCFAAKKAAHLKREAAKLQAAGKTVIAGNAARAIVSAQGQVKGAYVAVADMRATLKKSKGAELLTTVQIQDPRTGKVIPAYKLAELKATGLAPKPDAKAAGNAREDYDAQHRKAQDKAAQITAANMRLFKRVREAREGHPPGIVELRDVARSMIDLVESSDEFAFLVGVWEVPTESGIRALVDNMDAADLTRFILDCTVLDHCVAMAYGRPVEPQALLDAAERYGIDADAVRAEPPGGAPTPESAARAPTEAEAAPAGAKGKQKAKGKALRADQGHNAGDAGGSAQADLLEGEDA